MTAKPKAVLFDLDGTLIDSAPDFLRTVHQLREEDGLTPLSDDTIRQQVSNGGNALTCLTWDIALDHPDHPALRKRLLACYETHIGHGSGLFDGFVDTLQALEDQGIAWGIVTNKPRRYTDLLLERLNLQPAPHIVICPDDSGCKPKPDPSSLLKATTELKLEPQQCWYLGDHKRDIDAGLNAEMTTIAVTFGYIEEGDSADQWQAHHIIDKPQQLLALIP